MTKILHDAMEGLRAMANEVEGLRREIARLAPKAEAYDTIVTILRVAVPRPAQGYGEDLAWRARKQADEIQTVLDEGRRHATAKATPDVDEEA